MAGTLVEETKEIAGANVFCVAVERPKRKENLIFVAIWLQRRLHSR